MHPSTSGMSGVVKLLALYQSAILTAKLMELITVAVLVDRKQLPLAWTMILSPSCIILEFQGKIIIHLYSIWHKYVQVNSGTI